MKIINHGVPVVLIILLLTIGQSINTSIVINQQTIVSSQETAFVVNEQSEPESWSMFHHDLQHTGYSTSDAPDTNNIIWTYNIGESIEWSSSPAVVDEKLYIGSNDDKVYCLNANTGEKEWEFLTGGNVASSPAVYGNYVYIGSGDNKFYCLPQDDPNGNGVIDTSEVIWEFETGGSIYSSPAVIDDKVIFGSYDENIYCLYSLNGTKIWNSTVTQWRYSSPAIVGDKVYISQYCLNISDGALFWGPLIDDQSLNYASSTVVDNRVFIGSDLTGVFYCFDATNGSEIWSYSAGLLVTSTPAVVDDRVYIGSHGDKLYCFDADPSDDVDEGKRDFLDPGYDLIWSFSAGNNIVSSPAVADDKVYFGTRGYRTDEKFYCIDAEGNGDGTTDEFWNYTTGWTYSSPAVYDGKVFIASQSGILYCFRDNEAPAIPSQPSGSVEGEIGLEYTYSTDTTDPEGDDIEYLFDWGDGTDSGWIDTSSTNHSWLEEGTYDVKVKAKDSYGAESEWSSPAQIIIQILLPSLQITSPLSVREKDPFTVIVTSSGEPVYNVTVVFNEETKNTSSSGKVSFIAPDVAKNTPYTILAKMEGYIEDTTTITIVYVPDDAVSIGHIFGVVSDDTTGEFLQDVQIDLPFSDTGRKTVFTDENGLYIFTVEVGSYTLNIQKQEYLPTSLDVVIIENNAIEHNIQLEKKQDTSPSTSKQNEGVFIEYTLNDIIKDGKIGARIDMNPANQHTVSFYSDQYDINLLSTEDELTFTVGADDGTQGTIFVIRIGEGILEDLNEVDITYDGYPIIEKVSIESFFNHQDEEPVWLRVQTLSALYVFVKVSHFSEHTITIFSTVEEIVNIFLGPIGMILYLIVVAVCASVFLFPYFTWGSRIEKEKNRRNN